jgi:hypothetical protein
MATRGIMADNMFMGKSALLGWLNSTLMLKLEKIEDVSVSISTNFNSNYKICQQSIDLFY